MRKIERQLGKIVDQCLLGNYTKSFSKRLSKRDTVKYDHGGSQVTVFLWFSTVATTRLTPRNHD